MISKPDLSRLVEKIKKTIDDDVVIAKLSSPTFFEIYTALAFFYFKQQNVDFAVLETGLGGRLDATNVINPLVSVITPISLEHTQYLGNTLCQIANEKAGIIKKLVNSRREPKTGLSPEARRAKGENRKPIVITAPQEKEVLDVIKKRCKSVDARLYQPKTDKTLRPRLLGAHQLINASVAKASIETLGLKIKSYVIIEGIRNTVWPARCEVISTRPLIVLDGAQNVASVKALKNAIQDNFKYNRLLLILGISVDKDIAGICKELASIADRVIITKSKNPRAAKPQTILRHLTNLSNGSNLAKLTHSVKDALDLALKLAAMDDLILATGSLFMVGELRRLCRN
jgi:dihydrofolate synthase/folylpolyglutamate synthase